MRVLVVDQDSASNEAIVRSLRDLYTVDAVTNKGDCLDLLRSNTFEVIVAGERLTDGSGLELLGQIAKKWPSVLRVFAADRHRLKLLQGRLGPFELFQTLSYPIDPERLIAALSLADQAHEANADTANIQHVVLSGESSSQVSQQVLEPVKSEAPPDFPSPRPASRITPVEHAEAPSRSVRTASRGGAGQRRPPALPGQLLGGNVAAGPQRNRAVPGSSTRRVGTPLPSLSSRGGRPPRHDSARVATSTAAPVRLPTMPRPPSQPSPASSANRSGASQKDAFADAAAARAARSNPDSPGGKFDARRLILMAGSGAAVLAVGVLGFRLFHSTSEPPRPAAPPVVHVPEYPRADSPTPGNSSSSGGRATAKHNLQSRRSGVKAAGDNKRAADAAGSSAIAPTSASTSSPAAMVVETAHGQASGAHPANGVAASTPASASPPAPQPAVAQSPTFIAVPAIATPSAPPAPRSTHVQASTPPPTNPASPGEPPPVIREAKLIRRVSPHYPSAAKREGIQGSVDLEVTVSARGVVQDVVVVKSTPTDMFEKPALAAVRKWRYDPRFVDGLPSEARLYVHLDFRPTK